MFTKNIRLKEFGILRIIKKSKANILKSLNNYKNHKLVKSFSKNYTYRFFTVK